MPPKNTLRDGNTPSEIIKGENITNTRREKTFRILDPDGNVRNTVSIINDSRPDPDQPGSYIVSEKIDGSVDRAGNPLPKDPRKVIYSHSGLFINSPENMTNCTSRLHRGPSSNILIGQDGHSTPNGAICSRCENTLRYIYYYLIIIAIATILGIWKGAGIF